MGLIQCVGRTAALFMFLSPSTSQPPTGPLLVHAGQKARHSVVPAEEKVRRFGCDREIRVLSAARLWARGVSRLPEPACFPEHFQALNVARWSVAPTVRAQRADLEFG